MKRIFYLPMFAIILSLTSCDAIMKSGQTGQHKNPHAPKNTNNNQTATAYKKPNLKYGTDVSNNMAVVLPKNVSGTAPFILLIHGGQWTAGDKKEVSFLQDKLALKGIASAAINYRFASPSWHAPQMMQDVEKSIDYCVKHAAEWKVDNTQFVIGGASAGAHMAMLYAYEYDHSNRINAVISLAGPTDITDTKWLDYVTTIGKMGSLEYMVGADYNKNSTLAKNFVEVSPIYNIKNIPTLLIQGNADKIVYYSQSTTMDVALNKANVPHKLVTIPGADHDMGMKVPSNLTTVVNEMADWIKKYDK